MVRVVVGRARGPGFNASSLLIRFSTPQLKKREPLEIKVLDVSAQNNVVNVVVLPSSITGLNKYSLGALFKK